MSIPFSERKKYISMLFDYEEANNIPDNERLTYDPYKDIPTVKEVSPCKKEYIDIRNIIHLVKELKYKGLL